MDKLSTLSNSRDNNFNLIRAGAALGVFVSHCFPFTGHEFGGKPQLLGYLSLNVFFIISGFLVTKSYFDRGNVFSYLRSRVLRIFPGTHWPWSIPFSSLACYFRRYLHPNIWQIH